MSQLTDTVLELHGVLTRIEALNKQVNEVPASMKELQQEHDSTQAEIEALRAIIDETEIERRSAEGEAVELTTKADGYQAQISDVQTQREYGALLSEIDTSKGQAKESEERAIAATERHDEAAKTLEELTERFKDQDQAYQEQLAEWESQRPGVKKELKAKDAEAEALRQALPAQARAIFQRLYDMHDGQPLARIVSVDRVNKKAKAIWRCSECNYSIRPQLVVEVRTSEEIVLSECCRQKILVIEDPITE